MLEKLPGIHSLFSVWAGFYAPEPEKSSGRCSTPIKSHPEAGGLESSVVRALHWAAGRMEGVRKSCFAYTITDGVWTPLAINAQETRVDFTPNLGYKREGYSSLLKIDSVFYDARTSQECVFLDTQCADFCRNNRGRCVKKPLKFPEWRLVTVATKCGMGPSSTLLLAALLGKRFSYLQFYKCGCLRPY